MGGGGGGGLGFLLKARFHHKVSLLGFRSLRGFRV